MLTTQYPGARIDAVETVSGKVSEELATDGALAITFAMLGIAIYIWFRFEWQFGVGALVTLFHDVSMILGFFALTQLQVDLNIVAAFLAVVGYAQRYGRDLRPDPRESAQISQDGDRPVAQPVAERNAVADDRHLAVDHAGAGRAVRPWARRDLRADRSPSCSARSSALIRRSISRRRSWSGSRSTATAS